MKKRLRWMGKSSKNANEKNGMNSYAKKFVKLRGTCWRMG
jgi:hypothetical protein